MWQPSIGPTAASHRFSSNNQQSYARRDSNLSQIQPKDGDWPATIVKAVVVSADSVPSDSDLAAVVAAWPTLSQAVRDSILDQIRQ
jgi:hypothetical protein